MGSGLGGLCAAFEGLRAGYKVLLLEQHNLPGGYATSFVRGRFEFEPSLHEMPDLRNVESAPSVVSYLLDDAKLKVDLLPIPEAYRVILTDKKIDVSIPFGLDRVVETIEQAVPGSSEVTRNYLNLCREVQQAFQYLNEHQDDLNYKEFLKEQGNFVRTGAATQTEVAKAMNLPKEVQDILYPYWCYLGVPAERMSFSLWAALLDSYITKGAVIPRMRSHEFACAFLDKIYQLGGVVRFNAEVTEIQVAKGTVTGVKLNSGEIIKTSQVISNTSPSNVFTRLIFPKKEVPKAALKNINGRKLGMSLMVVYLGLNMTKEELGLEEYSYFIAPHMDTERLYENISTLESHQIMQASICQNAANPDCSPPGTCIVSITAGYQAEAWDNIAAEDYFDTKQRLAERLIIQFEEATGTNLRPYIEEIEIASPQTYARYTGAFNGVVYGYEPEPWDGIVPRALSMEKENYIKGLQFAGGFSYRAHGYGSSIMSGRAAAHRAKKYLEGRL